MYVLILLMLLDHDRFAVRESAHRYLCPVVGLYTQALEHVSGRGSPEASRRAELLLTNWRGANVERAMKLLGALPPIDCLTSPAFCLKGHSDLLNERWRLITDYLDTAQDNMGRPGAWPWRNVADRFWVHQAPADIQREATNLLMRDLLRAALPYLPLLREMRLEEVRRWWPWG